MSTQDAAADEAGLIRARAEASAWITRLHGPNRSADMEDGFRRWLAESPLNASEFEGLSELWELVAGEPAHGAPRMAGWRWLAGSRRLSGTRRLASAALIILACGLLSIGAHRFWFATLYTTSIGEQEIVLLDDGTRVSLNSGTRMRTAYGRAERKVYLQRGEAYFEVAHQPGRPFVVNAGDHRVTALGTSFVVRYEPDLTAVTLVEGKVSVAPIENTAVQPSASAAGAGTSAPRAAARMLNPGERLVLVPGRVEQLDKPRADAVAAWRRGEIVLEDTSLTDAVAELNRYDSTPIVIDDPRIAGLVVSGLYHAGDSEGFARSVATLHRIEVTEAQGEIHLKSR